MTFLTIITSLNAVNILWLAYRERALRRRIERLERDSL